MNNTLVTAFLFVGLSSTAFSAESAPKSSEKVKIDASVETANGKKDGGTLKAAAPAAVENKDRLITAKCALEFTADKKVLGTIVIGVYGNTVPKTANNFMVLCAGDKFKDASGKAIVSDEKFVKPLYKGTPVHRVIPKFMIQTGDIEAKMDLSKAGMGGYSIYGGKFPDENFTLKHSENKDGGSVSMANAGPNTNGSQIFITVAPTPWLDGKHVVFGEIVKGMDVAKEIEKLGSDTGATSKKIVISNSSIAK